MEFNVVGGTGEGAHSPAGVSTNNILVVTLVLGEGLLENGNPERAVGAELGEDGSTAVNNGEEVVDDHGVRNTKSVEVDSVDTVFGEIVVYGVQEEFLNFP